MRKITLLLLSVFTLGLTQVKADEGMWLPLLIKRLNYADMQKHGLKLTAEEIYSVNNSSIKDAIVALGGGFCTGEIISKEGLMLTNHHCGFGTIQENSTTEHDYLTDGFWAMTKDQEIPAGFGVWFLENMEDVTAKVLAGVTDEMNQSERQALVDANMAKIQAGESNEFTVQIKGFYHDNEYYLFRYKIFNDVRLVGAPPSSIGKFGGDTDNWMWPRHTGDFSMFRVYADKNNNPAEYSSDNVPYKPKHHLPVSIAGVKENDFAMIMGYPGSTDRYLTSYGVKEAIEIEQPARVKIRRMKLDIMEEGMNTSDKIRIQYASKHARISNYWKYFLGQSEQLVRNNVYDKKKKIENEFNLFAKGSDANKKKYGKTLTLIEEYYTGGEPYVLPNVYFEEAIFQGPDVFAFMFSNFGFKSSMGAVLDSEDEEKVKEAIEEIKASLGNYYKNFNQAIDQKLLASMLEVFYNDVDPKHHPEVLTTIAKKYKGDFEKFAEKYYDKSPFTSIENTEEWLSKFSKKRLEKDLVYQLSSQLFEVYVTTILFPTQSSSVKYEEGMRLFVNGLRKMNTDKVYASDANSTMRLTYGNILPYDAKDAVHYHYLTTLEGVMEKEVKTDNENHEFYVPKRLKDLYRAKDYGRYALPNGELPVGILSNNDITGGNSGSPVINGNGELIGTAFDGNWEAMSGDIYFEPNLQRTISVDIRYTLFIIDKYAGAKHLVDEMTVVGG